MYAVQVTDIWGEMKGMLIPVTENVIFVQSNNQRMKFFTTKIVDSEVDAKINLDQLNRLFSISELPERFKAFKKIIITLVARKPNDQSIDSWQSDGKFYLTIPLDYEDVLKSSEEEVTSRCEQLFKQYVQQLSN